MPEKAVAFPALKLGAIAFLNFAGWTLGDAEKVASITSYTLAGILSAIVIGEKLKKYFHKKKNEK